jgi:misacylated tRNA(Ala) deacylase
LRWRDGEIAIATTVKGTGAEIVLVPGEPAALPAVGERVVQLLDWDLRHRHMRVHTALHLLSVVIPLPVTGGSIGADKGRLDFDMPESPRTGKHWRRR